MPFRDMVHRHLCIRETLRERREIWYTDAVQRVLFDGAHLGVVVHVPFMFIVSLVHSYRLCEVQAARAMTANLYSRGILRL